MKPGRELDALIAEKVMGWKCGYRKESAFKPVKIQCYYFGMFCREHCPHYSTDIAAAWEVVENKKWESFDIWCDFAGRVYQAFVWPDLNKKVAAHSFISAPHAICLAALKAVGHEAEEE